MAALPILAPNFMDSLLLQYFVEYVTTPLFENRIIGDAIGSDNNPFENDKVRNCHLSAPGMLAQTTQLFYDSNLSSPIKRDPLDFLCESFELKKLVAEGTILETDLDLFQPALYDFKTEIFELTHGYEKTAQIASYLTIENVVGDEFTGRFSDQPLILLAQQTKQLIVDTRPVILDYIAKLPELRLAREQRIAEENRNRPAASATETAARPINSKCCVIL